MDYVYDIRCFQWDKLLNTFHAAASELYTDSHQDAFSNGRKQFYIKNNTTNNFRRFRFVEEFHTEDGLIYVFQSEDRIKCEIYFPIQTTL